MRQSIATRYHGPTNTRGSRVSATSSSGIRIALHWDDALNTDENHIAAARALIAKLGWSGQWAAGADRLGRVFVNIDDDVFTVGGA